MKPEDLNLNLLNALRLLLEERHVGRAAVRARVTQSAMSKNLAKLRDIFGDPLLVRVGGGFAPTGEGMRLTALLDPIFAGVGELLRPPTFDPATCRDSFTIALTDYVAEYALPPVLGSILTRAPGISITALGWEPKMLAALADGSVHMAATIVDDAPPWLERRRIDEDDFVCAMRPGHQLQGRLTLEAYCGVGHAALTVGGDKVAVVDRALEKLGVSRRIAFRAPYYAPTMEACARTDLLLTLPRHIARHAGSAHGLAFSELPFNPPRCEYSLIWHKRFNEDKAHSWVREILFAEMADSLYCH